VDAPAAEEIHAVVRVEIDQPRDDRLTVGDADRVGSCGAGERGAADLEDLAGADEEPRVPDAGVAGAGEQPAAGDDDVTLLGGGGADEQNEREETGESEP